MRKAPVLAILLSVMLLYSSASIVAQSDRLQVTATHTILADVVTNIVGDAADVTSLMPINTDPHTFTPTPADLARLSEADVVFVNGAFFEEGLLETIENVSETVNIVEASANVPILPFEGGHAHESEAEVADEMLGILSNIDCTAGHAHEEESEHEAGGCDPHVWWDVDNVILWAGTIRDTLSELDPANAETYAANADSYTVQLEGLRDELTAMIDTIPDDQRILVTDHDSLGYFAHAYGFEIVGVVVPGGSTSAEAGAAEFAALIDLIREEGVTAVFVGTTVSPIMSEQIANEAGAQIETLYTDSLSAPDEPAGTYLDFMRYNVETIVNALNQ